MRPYSILVPVTVIALLGSAAGAQELGPVIITEIMSNPHGTDPGQEWVEIYNPTAAAVDISRWSLMTTSGRTADFPSGISLAPFEVAVVAPKRGGQSGTPAQRQSTYVNTQASWNAAWGPGIRVIFVESFWDYPGDPLSVNNTIEGLDNSGDVLQLVNRTRVVVDEVHYSSDASGDTPWPDGNDSGSIQLLRDFCVPVGLIDNNQGAAWRLSGPGDALGSALAGNALPAFPGLDSYGTPGRLPVAVFTDCNGNTINDAIDIVHGAAVDSYPYNNIPDSCEGDCNANALPDLTEILLDWRRDRNANHLLDFCEINSAGGAGGVGGTLDANANGTLDSFENKPAVVITEVMYNPNGDDAGKEFVEIYNAGASPVSIAGWSLKDLEGDPSSGAIPAGTTMQPGEVIVLSAGSGPGVPADVLTQFRTAWNIPSAVRVFALSPWQDRAQRATSTEEVLALVDASGQPVDVVDYENPDDVPGSAWPDDDTASSIFLLPDALTKADNDLGVSWARSTAHIDGAYDSVQTAWFTDIRGSGSAGSPGLVWTTAHQTPTGDAVITEIMFHPNSDPGDPARAEWIEVYNPGPAALDVSGWYLRDEDGHTGGIAVGPGSLVHAGEVMVLIPVVGSGSSALAEAGFRAAWGPVCHVYAVAGWSDFEPIPSIGGLANNPAPGNEVLTLRKADGTLIDVVNFDDDGVVWPVDSMTASPGLGTAWSIALNPGSYTAVDNDTGQNWVGSIQGIGLAQLNAFTATFNGFDIGSPGLLDGVIGTLDCQSTTPSGCNLADITEVGGTSELPGTPDGQLTVDDIILFINLFSDSSGCPGMAPCSHADICGVGGPPQLPDGQLTVDDIIAFFNAFSDGC